MSGEPAAHSAPPSNNSFVNWQQGSETQPSMSGTQPIGWETQLSDIGIQPSESGSKSRKRKQGRNEAINELLEKVKVFVYLFLLCAIMASIFHFTFPWPHPVIF